MPESAPSPRPDTARKHRDTVVGGWLVTTSSGPASDLHERPLPTDPVPEVWIHHVERPALVLGSTQNEELLDLSRARADDVEVCRRRSGGGIVALTPDHCCWIDVIVPISSTVWDDDVGRAFNWLGETWTEALRLAIPSLGRGGNVAVHRGPLQGGAAGRLVCFASLGPGEVTVGGRKVVGISQRRTKAGARFQTVALGPWRSDQLEPYLDPDEVRAAGLDWSRLDIGLAATHWPGPDALAEAFCLGLPQP